MKVLWFCATPAPGAEAVGAPPALVGGWMAALEGALRQHGGVELCVAFPWRTAAGEPEPLAGGRYLPFPAYPRGGAFARLLVAATCRLEPASAVELLERLVERVRPDLVHVWGTESYFGLVAGRLPVPVLVEIQGLRTQCAEAYCSGLSPLDLLRFGSARRLLTGRSLLHRYLRYRRTAARERRILARARFVSGRTEWDRLACETLAPAARYFHCDRVLRAEFYDARWSRRSGGGPLRLVSTLRGNAYKGIDTVAECAGLLAERLPRGAVWEILGVRPGEEVHRMVERKLGVSFDRLGIRLLGRRPAGEVVERLTAADLFVHPSRIDNSPNGLCEAMMLGLPVVSTNVGGIPSLVDHRRDGLLVPPGDPWVMAAAVRRLAEDRELAVRLGAAARGRALERHHPPAVAARVADVYRQILAAAG